MCGSMIFSPVARLRSPCKQKLYYHSMKMIAYYICVLRKERTYLLGREKSAISGIEASARKWERDRSGDMIYWRVYFLYFKY